MTTTQQPTLGKVVGEQLSRIRMLYPATNWSREVSGEYQRVLHDMGDPEVIVAAVGKVIDGNDSRFCPTPGVFVRTGAEVRAASRPRLQRSPREESTDSQALKDAYAALEDVTLGRQPMASMFTRQEIEAQTASIRQRLGRELKVVR